MFAIFESGGHQYKARIGDEFRVGNVEVEVGSEVIFEKCLLYSKDGEIQSGKPYIDGVKVKATLVDHDKAKKIVVYKYRQRKGSCRKRGHRQPGDGGDTPRQRPGKPLWPEHGNLSP